MSSAPPRGRVLIGVSGWAYPRWRGDFYPKGLPHRRELEFIGVHFPTVELNGSFYSLQRPESYLRWRESVPADFVFAVKGSRYVTHMLRLQRVEQALSNFFASGLLALGDRLGPVLWQLPERQRFAPDVLQSFLDLLPSTTGEAARLARRHDERLDGRAWLEVDADRPLRHAFEPRSDSFSAPESLRLLQRHGTALVTADTAGRWPRFDALTADFAYVRLHGATKLYHSGYTSAELREWAALVCAWADGSGADDRRARDVYVYFDNDAKGHAPHDAAALQALVDASLPDGALGPQPRAACLHVRHGGLVVDTARASPLEAEVLHGVGEVHAVALDAGLSQRRVERPPGRADERLPRAVLAIAGLFAHEHQRRPLAALGEDHLRRVSPELTPAASGGRPSQVVHGAAGRHPFLCSRAVDPLVRARHVPTI